MNQERGAVPMDAPGKGLDPLEEERNRMIEEIKRIREETKQIMEATKRAVAWNEKYVWMGVDCVCGGGGGSKRRSRVRVAEAADSSDDASK
ncbi:MAG: hypothetical protein VW008_00025 [Aquiluna sp.]